jgi:tetratricopeptide (TPR) repeat protein
MEIKVKMKSNLSKLGFKFKPNLIGIDCSESGDLILKKFNIDYALDDLEEVSLWEFSNYSAVDYWLNDYEAKPNSSNLDKVLGYLEAFYHLINLRDWDNAWLIASTKLNTPNQENLFEQLGIWGYYKEVVGNLEILIGKISGETDAFCYLMLGNATQPQGQREFAMDYFQKSLKSAQKSSDKFLEGRVLINIGNLYRLKEDYDQSLVFFAKSLEITRESNNRLWEAVGLSFMALVFSVYKDFEKAIDYYLESLNISSDPEVNNLQWQSNALTNLANVYRETGNYIEAEKALEKGLKLAQQTSDRSAEGWALYQLGLLRDKQSDPIQAKELLISAKKLFEDLGNPSGQQQVQKELDRLDQQAGFS